ncbi:hypothetical protein AB2L28_09405 [Kineococcus sp. TBRC 1896]|uniref:Secreted protein n=1 Tax=Kineococcus mangrovi TaxID=1660183 RepID=A0ABV4I1P9_9ACTN
MVNKVGRVVPVLVMAVLVAVAGVVLLRQPAPTTARGTVTSAAPGEVCLTTSGHDVCLDREHVEHLALAGVRPGRCVDVTWTSDLVVAESLVRVTPC